MLAAREGPQVRPRSGAEGSAEDSRRGLRDVLLISAPGFGVTAAHSADPGGTAQGDRNRAQNGSGDADTSKGGCYHAHGVLDAGRLLPVYLSA